MSEVADTAEVEKSVAEMVGASFGGALPAEPVPKPEGFEFDADFQSRIVYLIATDQSFMRKTAHLLKPDYFENIGQAAFVAVAMRHWEKYECTMNEPAIMTLAIKDANQAKVFRKEMLPEITVTIREILAQRKAIREGIFEGLNSDFVADKVAEFVRQQAVIEAVTRAVELIDKKDYAKIEKLVSDATKIGLTQEEMGGDFFERLRLRTIERADEAAGKRPPRGITTGHVKLDQLLYQRGWGRKELTVLMGGAKAGKTMALIEFAFGAVMAGFNVLYVTLEVSNRIVEERADARFTDTPISDLVGHFGTVNDKVDTLAKGGRCGKFYIAEFPSGTMAPAHLRALLERHKAKGWNYDMIVVDYADLMQPDYRTNDPIENSKQVYVGLRAIGQEWNAALLTATQSNREGYKSITAKAEHVSDDFNKVRTADLFMTINSTEEERRDGTARLFFAAGRNQKSGLTLFIKQDFNRGQFIKMIERVE